MSLEFCITVPGVVSEPKFTSIMLTWSAPQEPNGVIVSYEVTYRVSDGNLVTTNTTDLRFTIPSLTSGTNVTEISVSAYTSVGRGDPVQIIHLMTQTLLTLSACAEGYSTQLVCHSFIHSVCL